MSTALEAASLIMVPSGYSDGMLGSVKPTDGSGNFTFTRGTDIGATRVAEDGYIEKGYENLLLQSNSFDTTWVRTNTTVTSGQSGYDGSSNAWKVYETIANGVHLINQITSSVNLYTFSVYLKSGTVNKIMVFDGNNNLGVKFNLETKSFHSYYGPSIIYNIDELQNGWARYSITSPNSSNDFRIYILDDTYSLSYIGNTANYVYIQDAQLNQGLVAMPYLPTTTTTSVGGILANLPRIDYTGGGCGSLLLEPSRTNAITQSEYFGEWSNLGNRVSFDYNTSDTLSPEGKYNATKLIKNLSGNPTLRKDGLVAGNAYVFTVWAKAGTSSLFTINISDQSSPVLVLTDEWQRFEVKTASSLGNFVDIELRGSEGINTYIYVWGAQVELGSYATSYIPTYGTSVTRAVDDVELPTLSSVFDSSGDYTILFEVERLAAPNESQFFYIRSSSFNYITLSAASGGKCEIVLYDGATVASATTPTNSFITSGSIKIAVKISGNNCSAFANGAVLTLNNTNTIPRGFDRYQNNRNHRKHQEVYFSTALSDAECIELTTI